MKKTLILTIALFFSVLASADELYDRNLVLDEALQEQNYDKIFPILYPQMIKKDSKLSEAEISSDLRWLSSKSELGHVPLYYFLSWKLIKTDIMQSRKYNAMGRIGLMLDAKECIIPPKIPTIYVMLEGRLFENNMPLREDNAAWAVAVNDALIWYKNHSDTPPASWYCGDGNTLEQEEAKTAKAAYWQKIKINNDVDLPHH